VGGRARTFIRVEAWIAIVAPESVGARRLTPEIFVCTSRFPSATALVLLADGQAEPNIGRNVDDGFVTFRVQTLPSRGVR